MSKWCLSLWRICSKGPKLVGASLFLSSKLGCSRALNIRKEPGQALVPRQAGSWNPLPWCLHLDSPLLQQQNAKKPQGTKVTAHQGQVLDESARTAASEEPGAKAGTALPPALRTRKGAGRPPEALQPEPWTHCSLTPYRELSPLPLGSDQEDLLLPLPQCSTLPAEAPVKPCLSFLPGL